MLLLTKRAKENFKKIMWLKYYDMVSRLISANNELMKKMSSYTKKPASKSIWRGFFHKSFLSDQNHK